MPKQTIPSPSVLHFRGGRRSVDTHAYPTMEGFFADLGAAYADAVADFAAAGCRYLQLDEVNIAYLCDPEQIEELRARGEHVEGLLETYADLINAAIARRPAEMTVSMHLCRGNFRSMHIASGGYDPVAEVLFNRINVDAYFMEYDTERAGTFAPLRFLPKGKTVVLGLVTSKTGELEAKDGLKRRIEEASKHVPARAARHQPAMRLRQHRGGQPAYRRRAVGEARAVRRGGAGGLGRGVARRRSGAAAASGAAGPLLRYAKQVPKRARGRQVRPGRAAPRARARTASPPHGPLLWAPGEAVLNGARPAKPSRG